MVKLISKKMNIAGISCALPGDPLNIFELESSFSEKDKKKFSKMTGVKELYRVNEEQTTIDLCIASAKKLLDKLEWNSKEIDGLIFVSQTPDHFLPISSAIAQRELGIKEDCFCFDINLGCSGYVYGLQVASKMLQKENCEKILLLVGDTISKIISPEDNSVSLLFGDAGTATAIEYKEDAKEATFILGTDGSGVNNLIVPNGAFRNRQIDNDSVRLDDGTGNRRSQAELYMNGSEIFNFTLREVPALIEKVIDAQEIRKEDIDYFVFHQANKFMIEQISRKIEIDKEKVPINIDKFGNTSSATIPLVLTDTIISENNSIKDKTILLAGFGVGYSWGAAVVNFKDTVVTDLIYV